MTKQHKECNYYKNYIYNLDFKGLIFKHTMIKFIRTYREVVSTCFYL